MSLKCLPPQNNQILYLNFVTIALILEQNQHFQKDHQTVQDHEDHNNCSAEKKNLEGERELTNHASNEEHGLNQPNLELVSTNQTPFRHSGAVAAADPLPRLRREAADAGSPSAVTVGAGGAPPVRFSVGEDHDHGVEGLERPGEAGEDEVFELPPAELAAVLLQHVVDAELLRRRFLGRLRQHRRAEVVEVGGQIGGHYKLITLFAFPVFVEWSPISLLTLTYK